MNINQDVKIKILPKGLAILEQERLKYGKFGIDAFPLIVEKDGLYLKLSMWEMMYL